MVFKWPLKQVGNIQNLNSVSLLRAAKRVELFNLKLVSDMQIFISHDCVTWKNDLGSSCPNFAQNLGACP